MLYTLPLVTLEAGGKVLTDDAGKASESFRNFVDKSIIKVMGRFKVMGYPPDEQAIVAGY